MQLNGRDFLSGPKIVKYLQSTQRSWLFWTTSSPLRGQGYFSTQCVCIWQQSMLSIPGWRTSQSSFTSLISLHGAHKVFERPFKNLISITETNACLGTQSSFISTHESSVQPVSLLLRSSSVYEGGLPDCYRLYQEWKWAHCYGGPALPSLP